MTPEAKVKAKVKEILNRHGVYYFSPLGTLLGRGGIPDIVCCYLGKFIGIECKAGRNTPSSLQVRELKAIREHGGIALVINEQNFSELEDTLAIIKTYENDRAKLNMV